VASVDAVTDPVHVGSHAAIALVALLIAAVTIVVALGSVLGKIVRRHNHPQAEALAAASRMCSGATEGLD